MGVQKGLSQVSHNGFTTHVESYISQFAPFDRWHSPWLKGVTGYTNLSLSLFIVNGLWFQPLLIQITNVN